MGQTNSKQDTGPASEVNHLLYPIGGGHVGEGPTFTNPIAVNSQPKLKGEAQQPQAELPATEAGAETAPTGSNAPSKDTSATAISNPIFEPEAGSSQPSGLKGSGEGRNVSPLSTTAHEPDGKQKSDLTAPVEQGESVNEPISAGSEKPQVTLPEKDVNPDVQLAPRTPEGVVPPPAPATHGPLYSSVPTKARLGIEEPAQTESEIQPIGAPGDQFTANKHRAPLSKTEADSGSNLVSSSTLPELTTDKALQRKASIGDTAAPPNTPMAAPGPSALSEKKPDKDVDSAAVTAPKTASQPDSSSTAIEKEPKVGQASSIAAPKGPTVADGNAVDETAPKGNTADASEAAPAANRPTVAEALPASAPVAQRAGKKQGNTGSLVPEEDKIGQGCLCFAPPGGKKKAKGQKDATGSTAATAEAAPAGAMVVSIPKDAANEKEADAAAATAIADSVKGSPGASKIKDKEGVPASQLADTETKAAPTPQTSFDKLAPASAEGPVSTPPATGAAQEALPSSRQVTEGGSAVPVPVVVPIAAGHHGKQLSKEEASELPPITDTHSSIASEPKELALPTGGAVAEPASAAPEPATTGQSAPGLVAVGAVPTASDTDAKKDATPAAEESTREPPATSETKALPETAGAVAAPSALKTPSGKSEEGAAMEAPLPATETPRKVARSVSFDEEPAVATAGAAGSPKAEAKPHAEGVESGVPPTIKEEPAAKEAPQTAVAEGPLAERQLQGEKEEKRLGLVEPPAANSDYLSSAEITEMPGIGKSMPETPETEAGSVLTGGTETAKPLTAAEKQAVKEPTPNEDITLSPLSQIQKAHEEAEAQGPSSTGKDVIDRPKEGTVSGEPGIETGAARSPVTDEGAATEATGAALAAGASAGSANAAAASKEASKKDKLAAKTSKKLEKQASKRDAQARATALKEKERQDKERFKQKRKEEREHKKEQQKRMQQEAAQAKQSKGGGGVGIFGFWSKSSKKDEDDKKKDDIPPSADAVGGTTPTAAPTRAGGGAAGAGLSGPAGALGASGTSRSQLGTSADARGVTTGNEASGYLASQGMKDEGSSSKAPEGTPEVSRLEDVTEGGSTAPEGKAGPSSSAAAAEVSPSSKDVVTEPSTATLPTSTSAEPSSPNQTVAVVFSTPFAGRKEDAALSKDAGVQPPTTPPQAEGTDVAAAAIAVPKADSKKKKKAKQPKVKIKKDVDYSAIQMQRVPSEKLRQGFNPATGQYDTTKGTRVPAGAYTPMRSNQPVLQQSKELQKRQSLERKKSMRLSTTEPMPLPQLRVTAPAGRGIMRPEASSNKHDYRPMSRSFA